MHTLDSMSPTSLDRTTIFPTKMVVASIMLKAERNVCCARVNEPDPKLKNKKQTLTH